MESGFELWRSIFYMVLTAGLFVTVIWLVIKSNAKGAIYPFAGAAICAFLSHADTFDSFKLTATSGFEARAKTAVAEAQVATKGLREVAIAASAAIVSMTATVSDGNMAMNLPALERDRNKTQILSLLRDVGATEAQIATVDIADKDSVIRQYEFSIGSRISFVVETKGNQADRSKLQELGDQDIYFSATKAAGLLKVLSFQDTVADELLADFDYYVVHGKQRRPEVWAARDTWQ